MENALENSASVDDYVEDDEETLMQSSSSSSSSSLCCCLPGMALGRWAKDCAARRHLLQQQRGGDQAARAEEESWLVRGAKKAKEASEVLAGPKWKNFIRRFSRKKRAAQFHYDPESYALNFSDGIDADGAAPRLEFSSRYADPSGIS